MSQKTYQSFNFLPNMIEFLAKVMSVPFPPARSSPSGFEKNLHTSATLRVVFFSKILHVGNTH